MKIRWEGKGWDAEDVCGEPVKRSCRDSNMSYWDSFGTLEYGMNNRKTTTNADSTDKGHTDEEELKHVTQSCPVGSSLCSNDRRDDGNS